ncbi:hypothetical protein D2E76_27325 [Mycobacteroides abscessus]|uniref:Uncharacterized protein n=1 Tax=Mycobacteroides abscessus TaxID=36809 RepID=A0ABD7HG65_9MYCO|nr:hypothetical protein [Mycobacteroides abscessus]RIT28651.1 hypothetical protein D2E76_27325 [Mycobacteroides abscessus]
MAPTPQIRRRVPIQQTLRNITRLPVKTPIEELMTQALSETQADQDEEALTATQQLAATLGRAAGATEHSAIPLNGDPILNIVKSALGVAR